MARSAGRRMLSFRLFRDVPMLSREIFHALTSPFVRDIKSRRLKAFPHFPPPLLSPGSHCLRPDCVSNTAVIAALLMARIYASIIRCQYEPLCGLSCQLTLGVRVARLLSRLLGTSPAVLSVHCQNADVTFPRHAQFQPQHRFHRCWWRPSLRSQRLLEGSKHKYFLWMRSFFSLLVDCSVFSAIERVRTPSSESRGTGYTQAYWVGYDELVTRRK